MTKSGVKEVWQVFEWKHIISTSNSQLKGDLPHEQEYLKGISFARLGIFPDNMRGEGERDSFKAEDRESGFMSYMRSHQPEPI
jgi:hypothetical protein